MRIGSSCDFFHMASKQRDKPFANGKIFLEAEVEIKTSKMEEQIKQLKLGDKNAGEDRKSKGLESQVEQLQLEKEICKQKLREERTEWQTCMGSANSNFAQYRRRWKRIKGFSNLLPIKPVGEVLLCSCVCSYGK